MISHHISLVNNYNVPYDYLSIMHYGPSVSLFHFYSSIVNKLTRVSCVIDDLISLDLTEVQSLVQTCFMKHVNNLISNFIFHAQFETSNGCKTIIPKDRRYLHRIGMATGLSFHDIKLANLMYNCNCKCQHNALKNMLLKALQPFI